MRLIFLLGFLGMKIIISLLFLLSFVNLSAQITPVQNDDSTLIKRDVKSLSTYYQSKDTNKEYLIFQKEFASPGKLLRKFQLYLWDAVSYSYTTYYNYNNNELLTEETKSQEILTLFNRDKEYIKTFGDASLNEKILYYYSDEGLLIKKAIYTFSTKDLESNAPPSQTINYTYENGVLVSEESASPDEKIFNKNYLIEYSYDSAGNMSKKTMAYGKEKELQRTTLFKYNTERKVIEKQVLDTSIPHNNVHLKYDYTSDGRVSNKYIFNETEKEFELETTYKYDLQGNKVSGEREVKFEYYEDGLIKKESWTELTSPTEISLTTKFEFF